MKVHQTSFLALFLVYLVAGAVPAKKRATRIASVGYISSQRIGLSVGDFADLTPSSFFGTTRSWNSGGLSFPLDWSDMNPSSGEFRLGAIDNFISFNAKFHADAIYTFGRTPRWASSQPDNDHCEYGPGECAPPRNMGDWDAFVKAVATHAAGRIKYWELWDEPQDATLFSGDLSMFVAMASHARAIIKSIDPDAVILGPSVTGPNGPQWMASFLAAGGGKYIDVVTFHGYFSATAEDILKVIADYKAVLRNTAYFNLPIWDTEGSWAAYGNLGTPNMDRQVAFIPKYYLLHFSQGISRVLWYAYDGGPTWGGLETRGHESLAAISFRQTYLWLNGASLVSPCTEDNKGTWVCTLSRPGNYAAEIVWNSSRVVAMTVPRRFRRYRDLGGHSHSIAGPVTIGNEPILLENNGSEK